MSELSCASLLTGTVALLVAAPVTAGCQIAKYLELSVTMEGQRPIVAAQINGRDARFILDSGAFFSAIAKANALEYGLTVGQVAFGARMKGIGGDASVGVATAREFRLGGQSLPHVQFAVGGSDTGYAGLLGQNILGIADVEYDLPHGMVRIMTSRGCDGAAMAYWAGSKPFTMVELERMDARQRHTIGTIKLNGVAIKAAFDTGAEGSVLTLSAAKRIGVAPGGTDATVGGFGYGIGQKRTRMWRTRFDTIDIGGEAIRKPTLAVVDQSLDGPDMLIGADFFLTHRVYVDNQAHRMFITYEGGPLFGLNPRRAVDNSGAVLDLADHGGEPPDADGYSRRGARLAANRQFEAAIGDLDKALSLAPSEPRYLVQRALVRLANRQLLLAAADLDRAIALAPGDADSRLARARLRIGGHDAAGALTDLAAADKALAPSADARLQLASMYTMTDNPEVALDTYDQWLRSHAEDSGRPEALNGRCWVRALLNRDLDQALSDCNAALRARPGDAAYLDSRALVRLRRGELDKALADYDAAIAARPQSAWPHYARSIVARRLGNAAQADADRAAAVAIDAQVAVLAERYGIDVSPVAR